jgi:hypothetical protein
MNVVSRTAAKLDDGFDSLVFGIQVTFNAIDASIGEIRCRFAGKNESLFKIFVVGAGMFIEIHINSCLAEEEEYRRKSS